ncbi:MAG: hypothetical protein C0625_01950 [Arcobacter sp.]|nr:MAG: hypothetical protein C0625_01950 [Arcobacter sp.]
MGREKILKLGAINIVQHPHTEEKQEYIELFEEIAKNPIPTKIRGQYYGLIDKVEVNRKEGFIFGKFYRYTNINKNSPWLNIKEKSPIVDDDGKAVQQVEDHIKPNLKEIYFYFIIKNHRLVFDSKIISPNSIKEFLRNVISNTDFKNIKRESVNITVEQSAESLDEILNMYFISQIDLIIDRPNPDDISPNLETGVKRRLENMEADSYQQVIKSDHSSIKPDKELKDYMGVARSNGSVNVKGKDETGKSISESTESHSLEVKTSYNDGEETYLGAFKSRAFIVVSDIMEKLRN